MKIVWVTRENFVHKILSQANHFHAQKFLTPQQIHGEDEFHILIFWVFLNSFRQESYVSKDFVKLEFLRL